MGVNKIYILNNCVNDTENVEVIIMKPLDCRDSSPVTGSRYE